jgi:Putative viral replication protein.
MPQSRKWLLTFNNPTDHGYSQDAIVERLEGFVSVLYWCLCDEIGSEGTYHTHLYIAFKTPRLHSVLENAFPGAHRDVVRGTSQQNRDYILKDGEKYNKQPSGSYDYVDNSGKRHQGTNYTDTFLEWGELPQERQGKSKDVERIYNLVKDGASNHEIVEAVPSAMLSLEKVNQTRSMLRDSEYANKWRELAVTYIFGGTGTGKTRSVMDKYGYENCYRVTDYKHPFDTYDGQDVIIFEEFRGGLKNGDMLNYLDGYPLLLPCRYFNRQACYTKVFIITNVPPESQYVGVDLESRKAFFRRIDKVLVFDFDCVKVYDSVQAYNIRSVSKRYQIESYDSQMEIDI